MENWHSSFNPKNFLSRVNLDKLIERNEAYNENEVSNSKTPCIICNKFPEAGILLNDKSFLCKSCYSKVSQISYPSKYENAKRQFLKKSEARGIALQEFTQKYEYFHNGTPLTMLATCSLSVLFLGFEYVWVPIILFFLSFYINREQKLKAQYWNKQKSEWESRYPKPKLPKLKHFHDPQAILAPIDHKILKVFNNWPGYPPFWKYLREIILAKDNHHCQVSGCPSRVSLHIHHKKPVSQGGEHVPSNLVTLCDFHHALEPDDGHERIWDKITTRYFTMVNGHTRHNKSNYGRHSVRAHVRRLALVNADELNEIKNYYSLSCPTCESESICITVKSHVLVNCPSCLQRWNGFRGLTEETGPRLAELLTIKKNKGTWFCRWNMLSERTDSVFHSLINSNKPVTRKKAKFTNIEPKKSCPKCGSSMILRQPKSGASWVPFLGCSMYRTNGCKGTSQV